jgi:hypothetical protein
MLRGPEWVGSGLIRYAGSIPPPTRIRLGARRAGANPRPNSTPGDYYEASDKKWKCS